MDTLKTITMYKIPSFRVCIFILSLLLLSNNNTFAQCSTVDQSQLNYTGGMSAHNLDKYTVWQDFVAGTSGTLCQIDVGFFNAMTGTGTLNIYSGSGTGGVLLQSQTVTVSGSGTFFQAFSVSVPVTSASAYTFQFIPIQGGGLPEPYGVQIEFSGTYPGGEMRITDPSGTYATGYNMVFKTYVSITTQVSSDVAQLNSVMIFPNPFSSETNLKTEMNLKDATLIVRNLIGQEVKRIKNINGQEIKISRENLNNGIYFIQLVQGNSIIAINKIVIED